MKRTNQIKKDMENKKRLMKVYTKQGHCNDLERARLILTRAMKASAKFLEHEQIALEFLNEVSASLKIDKSFYEIELPYLNSGYRSEKNIQLAFKVKVRYGIRSVASTIYQYSPSNGALKQITEAKLKGYVQKLSKSSLVYRQLEEVMKHLLMISEIEYSILNSHLEKRMIHTPSCMLSFQGENIIVSKHSISHHSTSPIGAHYKSTAKCPMWIAFLDKSFDLYGEEKSVAIKLLQEFMFYLFLKGNFRQKMLFIQGKPRTGKTIVTRVIEELLSVNNISSFPMEDLSVEKNLASLMDKMVNISGELPAKGRINSTRIKEILGEDMISARKMYEMPYEERCRAKLISLGNYIPELDDTSNAMIERIVVLEMNNVVPLEERDPELLDKLKLEISGIFNWVLEGRISFFATKYFTEPQSSEHIKNKIINFSNSVKYWSEECKELLSPKREDEKFKTFTIKDAYASYQKFTKENGGYLQNLRSFRDMFGEIEGITVYRCPTLNQYVFDYDYIEEVIE